MTVFLKDDRNPKLIFFANSGNGLDELKLCFYPDGREIEYFRKEHMNYAIPIRPGFLAVLRTSKLIMLYRIKKKKSSVKRLKLELKEYPKGSSGCSSSFDLNELSYVGKFKIVGVCEDRLTVFNLLRNTKKLILTIGNNIPCFDRRITKSTPGSICVLNENENLMAFGYRNCVLFPRHITTYRSGKLPMKFIVGSIRSAPVHHIIKVKKIDIEQNNVYYIACGIEIKNTNRYSLSELRWVIDEVRIIKLVVKRNGGKINKSITCVSTVDLRNDDVAGVSLPPPTFSTIFSCDSRLYLFGSRRGNKYDQSTNRQIPMKVCYVESFDIEAHSFSLKKMDGRSATIPQRTIPNRCLKSCEIESSLTSGLINNDIRNPNQQQQEQGNNNNNRLNNAFSYVSGFDIVKKSKSSDGDSDFLCYDKMSKSLTVLRIGTDDLTMQPKAQVLDVFRHTRINRHTVEDIGTISDFHLFETAMPIVEHDENQEVRFGPRKEYERLKFMIENMFIPNDKLSNQTVRTMKVPIAICKFGRRSNNNNNEEEEEDGTTTTTTFLIPRIFLEIHSSLSLKSGNNNNNNNNHFLVNDHLEGGDIEIDFPNVLISEAAKLTNDEILEFLFGVEDEDNHLFNKSATKFLEVFKVFYHLKMESVVVCLLNMINFSVNFSVFDVSYLLVKSVEEFEKKKEEEEKMSPSQNNNIKMKDEKMEPSSLSDRIRKMMQDDNDSEEEEEEEEESDSDEKKKKKKKTFLNIRESFLNPLTAFCVVSLNLDYEEDIRESPELLSLLSELGGEYVTSILAGNYSSGDWFSHPFFNSSLSSRNRRKKEEDDDDDENYLFRHRSNRKDDLYFVPEKIENPYNLFRQTTRLYFHSVSSKSSASMNNNEKKKKKKCNYYHNTVLVSETDGERFEVCREFLVFGSQFFGKMMKFPGSESVSSEIVIQGLSSDSLKCYLGWIHGLKLEDNFAVDEEKEEEILPDLRREDLVLGKKMEKKKVEKKKKKKRKRKSRVRRVMEQSDEELQFHEMDGFIVDSDDDDDDDDDVRIVHYPTPPHQSGEVCEDCGMVHRKHVREQKRKFSFRPRKFPEYDDPTNTRKYKPGKFSLPDSDEEEEVEVQKSNNKKTVGGYMSIPSLLDLLGLLAHSEMYYEEDLKFVLQEELVGRFEKMDADRMLEVTLLEIGFKLQELPHEVRAFVLDWRKFGRSMGRKKIENIIQCSMKTKNIADEYEGKISILENENERMKRKRKREEGENDEEEEEKELKKTKLE